MLCALAQHHSIYGWGVAPARRVICTPVRESRMHSELRGGTITLGRSARAFHVALRKRLAHGIALVLQRHQRAANSLECVGHRFELRLQDPHYCGQLAGAQHCERGVQLRGERWGRGTASQHVHTAPRRGRRRGRRRRVRVGCGRIAGGDGVLRALCTRVVCSTARTVGARCWRRWLRGVVVQRETHGRAGLHWARSRGTQCSKCTCRDCATCGVWRSSGRSCRRRCRRCHHARSTACPRVQASARP